MDRLDAMSLMVTVVESGSFSGAARRLGLPLTTVSRRISDLEAHLQTRLLERSTRRLALTDAGETYLAACRRILEDVGEAERAAAGEYRAPRGQLVVTAPAVLGRLHLLPVVAEYLGAYPEVDVRLILADRVANLLEDHIDVALRVGALADSSQIAIRVGSIRPVVCASPAYLARRGRPATPEDLSAHECITFDGLGATDGWRFRLGSAERVVPIHSRLIVNGAEAAVDAAVAGLGITRVLCYQMDAALASGRLVELLEEDQLPPHPVHLVHGGGRRLPLKLRAFLDFARPRLQARLPGSLP